MSVIESTEPISREQSDILGWTKRHHNSKDPARIFERIVIVDSGCWEYQGKKSDWGHGVIKVHNNAYYTHRVSYLLKIGPIPDGLQVLHTCDNPPCINPEHFFIGTATENMKDRDEKRRQAFGERNGRSKLTEDQVRLIRLIYSEGKRSHRSLSNEFKVSHGTMAKILTNQLWGHL